MTEGSACEGCGKDEPTTRKRPDKVIPRIEVYICDPCDLLRKELAA